MRSRTKLDRSRAGQSLVEFAFIALVLYLLLAAITTFGLLLWQGQMLQQAVDVAAQEIARTPFPPTIDLFPPDPTQDDGKKYAASTSIFKQQIYDEKHLFIPQSDLGGQRLTDYAQTLPLLNRLLVPAMIFDSDQGAFRYPGAIVKNNTTGQTTVMVPLILDYNSPAVTWVAPVEEMKIKNDSGDYVQGPFSLTAHPDNKVPGIVALRINYPHQSATMSGYKYGSNNPIPGNPGDPYFGPNIGSVVIADDNALTVSDPSGYTLQVAANPPSDPAMTTGSRSVVGGRLGLGQQQALGQTVRPYRTVISVQAIYRREVFGDLP